MTYSIRRMQFADLEQVAEIDREAFPDQWPTPNYRQELANKLAYYIVLRDDKRSRDPGPKANTLPRKTSFLDRLFPWRSPRKVIRSPEEPTHDYLAGFSGIWLLVDEAHITNIAVRNDYQGRGLGEYLLIATYDLAIGQHAKIMTLEVRVSNTVAQNLYKKLGFEEKGVRKGYYLDNREDALIMTVEDIDSDAYRKRIESLRKPLAGKLKTA